MKTKYFLCASKDRNYEIVESETVPKTISNGGDFWLRGVAYDSLDELKSDNGVLETPCLECGGVAFTDGKKGADLEKITTKNICPSCLFWDNILDDYRNPKRVIIDGTGYFIKTIGKNKAKSMIGFGGRKFKIKKNSGEVIETNDLWHNGDVPENFKNRIKNNAVFL